MAGAVQRRQQIWQQQYGQHNQQQISGNAQIGCFWFKAAARMDQWGSNRMISPGYSGLFQRF
jgi:hypothetical protein